MRIGKALFEGVDQHGVSKWLGRVAAAVQMLKTVLCRHANELTAYQVLIGVVSFLAMTNNRQLPFTSEWLRASSGKRTP
jgi:hypothetical protein